MRHIVISEDGANIAENAYLRLASVMYYPEDQRGQEQAYAICLQEKAEFDCVGLENYQPSDVMQAAQAKISKRFAQIYTVGLVALTYVWLSEQGQKPSLNRASAVVSCAANEFNKIVWRSGLDPQGADKTTAVSSDPSTIERTFRKYRSAAHLCATHISSSDYIEIAHLFSPTPESVASLIQTAAYHQESLERVADVSTWNIWDVKRYYPASMGSWPIFTLTGSNLHWVRFGYQEALSQGLLMPDRKGGT